MSTESANDNIRQSELLESEVHAQLERIFASDSFQRSRRLQDFLKYITELTLEGREEEINEHLIGIEVFGRGSEYNPSEDSVVRRQAHSLRQKLDEYYGSEGADDPIIVEVPLGHYIPAFRKGDSPEPAGPAVGPAGGAAPEVERLQPARHSSWRWAAVCVMVAAAAFIGGRTTARQEGAPEVRRYGSSQAIKELWSPWLSSGAGPLICFSTPYTGVVKHFLEPLPPDSEPHRLKLTGELEAAFRSELGFTGGKIYISPSYTETKSGEALGAIDLANLFSMNGLRARGVQSRLLTWEMFRQDNIILMGHSEQNRWVVPVLEKYPLTLEDTHGAQQRRIVNTAPRPGEPAEFRIDYAEDDVEATVEYALVSMLPGLDDRHQLLVISGLNTQATLMGIEFLTDPLRAQTLLAQMREEAPAHQGSWRFQIVLSTEVHDKVPTGGAVKLIRVLK